MADTKISALTALTTPADADELVIVDDNVSTTKKITWANIKTALGSVFAPYRVSINTQTGTTYTAVSADNGKLIVVNNASAHTLTLPSLTAGTVITVFCQGAGGITFSASGTSFLGSSPSVGCAQNEGMQAIYVSSTTIAVIGGTA